MARWNNGFVDVNGDFVSSDRNTVNDSNKSVSVGTPLSNETRKQAFQNAIRRSRGRFTSQVSAGYVFSDIRPKEHTRRQYDLPFVDFPGARQSDGGDLRDVNALGGGMPPGIAFYGGGTPGRQSVYARRLALHMDHPSPVPRR